MHDRVLPRTLVCHACGDGKEGVAGSSPAEGLPIAACCFPRSTAAVGPAKRFSRRPPGNDALRKETSTELIVVLVVVVVAVILVLAFAQPRARERQRVRRVQEEHRQHAGEQRDLVEEHSRRAKIAGAEARRAEAEAEIAQAEAERHELAAEGDGTGLDLDADPGVNNEDRDPARTDRATERT